MELIETKAANESQRPPETESGNVNASFDFGPAPGAPDPDQAGAGRDGDPRGHAGADPETGTIYIGKEEFFGIFRAAIEAPNIYLQLKRIDPLESLKTDPADPYARAASDALYDTLWEIPILRRMLELEGKWTGRIVAIGTFFVMKAALVRAELEARVQAAEAARDQEADPEEDEIPRTDKPAAPPADEGPGVDQGVVELKVGG